ncbi:MAG: hypothetical protein KGN16_08945 [Burkholderiales bacterium]|nr:hypothetical protein [Burkholderiales bacterium]
MTTTKRVRYFIVAALVAAVVGLLLWIVAGMAVRTSSVESGRLTVPTAPTVAAETVVVDSSAQPRASFRQREARVLAAAAPGSAATGADVWDLCGIGRLPKPPGSAASGAGDWFDGLPPQLGSDAVATGMERLLEVLAAGDARSRAAAIVLGPPADERGSSSQQLTDLALSSRDPVIALWALQRCSPGPQGCPASTVDSLVPLDPDNIAFQLWQIAAEPQRSERLFASMAQASRFKMHDGSLLATVQEAMPADLLPYVQQEIWVYVLGIEAAQSYPAFQSLTAYCRPGEHARPDRAATCHDIAQTLISTSDSLIGELIGLRIALWTGMPQAEFDARRAALHLIPPSPWEQGQPRSCASIERFKAQVELRAREGEMGVWRAAAAAASQAPR